MGLASINIRFKADLTGFSSQMQNTSRELQVMGQKLQSVGRGLSAAITIPIVGLGVASLKTFGNIQALEKGLISVMGSSEAAASEFKKLKEVAKLPGLGLEEAVRGSVNLQAAGFSADDARRALLSFGNALATVGKGKRELDLVTLAITQLNNKSGGFGQDLKQLTEQLPQLRGALQNAFGTVDTDAISKSGVTGKQVVNALITEFEKLPKVTGGINNAFENFSDSTKLALSSFGNSINKAFNIEGLLNSLGEKISNLADKFSNLSPEAQKIIVVFAGVAAAIGPVLIAIGAITSFVPSVVAGLVAIRGAVTALTTTIAANPIGALAVALSLIVGSFFLFNQETDKAITKVDTLNQLNEEASSVISAQKSQLEQYLSVARDDNKSKAERQKAIKELNKISPEYLGNLKLEKINTDEAKNSIELYNVALLEAGKAKAAQSALQANYSKQLQAELKFENATAGSVERILEAQKKLNTERGSDKYFQVLREINQLTQEQQELLNSALDPLKKEEAIILSVFNKYKDKLGLLKDVNSATMDLSKSTEKVFTPGTVAFYEEQIRLLQGLQKETVTSSSGWDQYGKSIESVQKKIDLITGKVGVKLPKPELPNSIENETPPIYTLNLADYDRQIQRYRELQSQFSDDTDEGKAAFQRYKELINDTQLKINEIKGVKENSEILKKYSEDAAKEAERVAALVEGFNQNLTASINSALGSFAEGFGQIIGQFASGGNVLQNIGSLFLGTLAGLMDQVGKIAIQTGIAIIGIKKALESLNPALAIGAGVALIALSSLIKSQMSSAGSGGSIPGFANGGIVGGSSYYGDKILARINSGELIANSSQQKAIWNAMSSAGSSEGKLTGEIKLRGSDLLIAVKRAEKEKDRNS